MNVYSKRGIRHRVLGDSVTLGAASTICGAGTRDMATVRWFGPVTDCKKCFREVADHDRA